MPVSGVVFVGRSSIKSAVKAPVLAVVGCAVIAVVVGGVQRGHERVAAHVPCHIQQNDIGVVVLNEPQLRFVDVRGVVLEEHRTLIHIVINALVRDSRRRDKRRPQRKQHRRKHSGTAEYCSNNFHIIPHRSSLNTFYHDFGICVNT